MESPYHEPIIPGLPDDLAMICLAKISHGYHGLLETVSKRWRDVLRGSEYASFKAKQGWCGDWLFVLTKKSKHQWIAYDPQADRWHPIPMIPRKHDYNWSGGFGCVCVRNRFLVIGGAYSMINPEHTSQRPFISNQVFQFDPFKKEWSEVASMRTPRSFFACSVMSGKVYVAGGCNVTCRESHRDAISLAEVYDPLTDKWEELAPMCNPMSYCSGLSYNGKLYVVKDEKQLFNTKSQKFDPEMFDPLKGVWQKQQEAWPIANVEKVTLQVTEDGRLYAALGGSDNLVKTIDEGDWYVVAKVPFLNRPLSSGAYHYAFAALGNELYTVGGKFIQWDTGYSSGSFRSVDLDRAMIWDASSGKWREARPMSHPSSGVIRALASLKQMSRST